jgi:cytochrome c-type biogenesis protein CcmH
MRHAIPPLRGAKARRFGRDDGVVKGETVVRLVALALALLLHALPAHAAITPDEILADPALEERARGITKQLRCLVCQNQSIDDSNAPLARDLRMLVRERLKAGDSDGATLNFVVARYGDFVLLRPPVKATTWLLWFGPALLLLAGVAFLWMRTRQRRVAPAAPAPLDAAEEKKLAELMSRSAPGKEAAP